MAHSTILYYFYRFWCIYAYETIEITLDNGQAVFDLESKSSLAHRLNKPK